MGVKKMKDYITILSRVKHSLKFYSKDYVRGYIYGLFDWRVIDEDTHGKLDDYIGRYEKE